MQIPKIIRELIAEHQSETLGKERMVALLADQLVVEVIRYIFKKNLFAPKFHFSIPKYYINTLNFKIYRLILKMT